MILRFKYYFLADLPSLTSSNSLFTFSNVISPQISFSLELMTAQGMVSTSPHFTECGRFRDTVNGLETVNVAGFPFTPKPVSGSIAKAVTTQLVNEFGTVLFRFHVPLKLEIIQNFIEMQASVYVNVILHLLFICHCIP